MLSGTQSRYSSSPSSGRLHRTRMPPTPALAPTVPQIPLPPNLNLNNARRRKALDISASNSLGQPARGRSVNVITTAPIDKVGSPYLPAPTPSRSQSPSHIPRRQRLPLWHPVDEEITVVETDAWTALMSPPSKSKRRQDPSPLSYRSVNNATTSELTAVNVLSTSYKPTSGAHYYIATTAAARSPSSSRSKSLSPNGRRYPTASPSSSSTSSSSSSSRTTSPSPSSSTSTLITDPDSNSCASRALSTSPSELCLSPRSRPILLLPQTPRITVTTSFGDAVPFGRDPLSLPRIDTTFGALSIEDELTARPTAHKMKIASLLQSAIEFIADVAVGRILLDGYSSGGLYGPIIERDSLGLEKSSLSASPSSPETCALSLTAESPGRPRSARRQSLRDVSSDPMIYYQHSRAPSIQKRRQAFGPMDIKPYGYRVGPKEVQIAFSQKVVEPKVEAEQSSFLDGMFLPSAALIAEAEAMVSNHQPTPSQKRSTSPPTSAIVALQRYPIIPYNPPGPGLGAEEEILPKVRDRSVGKLWYLELVPGGSDGKIDDEVGMSCALDAESHRLFASFPRVRRGSSERSTSPQRGRCRSVRPLASPRPSSKLLPTRPLSSKHLRAPPATAQPSMYLLWALKGSMGSFSSSSDIMEGWNGPRKISRKNVVAGVNSKREEALRGSARRRIGEDGCVKSSLRWEVHFDEENDDEEYFSDDAVYSEDEE